MRKQIILLLLTTLTYWVNAQEKQLSIDSNGKLMEINSKLDKKLQLFSNYTGFSTAKLFQTSDSTFALEIFYTANGSSVKERKTMTVFEAELYRRKVSNRINSTVPEIELNQEGRTNLLITTTFYGAFHYGIAVPFVLNISTPREIVGAYMLTVGASFFVPFVLTKNRDVTKGQATLSLFGQFQGIIQGNLLGQLLRLPSYRYYSPYYEETQRIKIGSGMVLGVTEGLMGFWWAKNNNMTYGTASAIGIMGNIGLGIGVGVGNVLDFNNDYDERKEAGVVLSGSVLGLATGYFLSKNGKYTRGDAEILAGTSLLGAYLPTTFATLGYLESDSYAAIATIGSIGGTVIGHLIAQKYDFTTKQGIMINLSGYAGALIGGGIGFVAFANSENAGQAILISSAIGAVTSFALMTKYYIKKDKKDTENKKYSFHFNLNPNGIMRTLNKNIFGNGKLPANLFKAQLTF